MTIEFVRLGDTETDLVRIIAERAAPAFEAAYIVPEEAIPLPEEAYSPDRGQYRADVLMQRLRMRETDADYVLGIADDDLFTEGLNFVFGQAEIGGSVGVIALARLHPEFFGNRPDRQLFLDRCVKEAVHELGHVMGLHHCENPDCVMHFSNRLSDTDRKHATFCEQCERKLEK